MNKPLSSKVLFISGFIIIIFTNILVLSGVFFNRSGKPESIITLTERELFLPYFIDKENSGLKLNLRFRTLSKHKNQYTYYHGAPAWLDQKKLKQLKIKLEHGISKQVFIVLEYNHDLYNESVRRTKASLKKLKGGELKNGEKRLKDELTNKSRLFAVDAGIDYKTLKQKYKNQSRYLIIKGLIEPMYNYCANKKKETYGIITKLTAQDINVPKKHRKIFDHIMKTKQYGYNKFKLPRYKVKLAFGRRLEPWIISVNKI